MFDHAFPGHFLMWAEPRNVESLMHAFVQESYDPTIEDFYYKENFPVDDEPTNLEILDTAGQVGKPTNLEILDTAGQASKSTNLEILDTAGHFSKPTNLEILDTVGQVSKAINLEILDTVGQVQ